MTLYVTGGGYWKQNPNTGKLDGPIHSLVKPTKGNPYVFLNPNGATPNLCKHHAHLYRLSENRRTAHLVRRYGAGHVTAPTTLELSDDDHNGVIARINGQGSDGISND